MRLDMRTMGLWTRGFRAGAQAQIWEFVRVGGGREGRGPGVLLTTARSISMAAQIQSGYEYQVTSQLSMSDFQIKSARDHQHFNSNEGS